MSSRSAAGELTAQGGGEGDTAPHPALHHLASPPLMSLPALAVEVFTAAGMRGVGWADGWHLGGSH